jgi:hypothetical protein
LVLDNFVVACYLGNFFAGTNWIQFIKQLRSNRTNANALSIVML